MVAVIRREGLSPLLVGAAIVLVVVVVVGVMLLLVVRTERKVASADLPWQLVGQRGLLMVFLLVPVFVRLLGMA